MKIALMKELFSLIRFEVNDWNVEFVIVLEPLGGCTFLYVCKTLFAAKHQCITEKVKGQNFVFKVLETFALSLSLSLSLFPMFPSQALAFFCMQFCFAFFIRS